MMPTYSFKNKKTGEEFEDFMTMDALDKFLKNNRHIEQTITQAPALGDPIRLGLKKPDAAFRDRLKEIKKKHSQGATRSTVNTW
jgi:hypothetical protein